MSENQFLFTRHPNLERSWPFLHERMVTRLDELGTTLVLNTKSDEPIHQQIELENVVGIARFGGKLTAECVAHAPKLRMVGTMDDNTGKREPFDVLQARNIPLIEATRAWSQSVAECAFGLALSALRRTAQWHHRMANKEPLWTYAYGQYCDAPDFVNGDLGTKHIGVVGLGQIGRKIAQWCRAFGAKVDGYDPFVDESSFKEWDVRPVDMDMLVSEADIVFVAVPPTPSARHLLSRERIHRLHKGALVVAATRALAIDMDALRERILAGELAGAFDVYDVEPLPVDDPLRGRDNVVHTPHIAGRTKDANLRVADMIVDDFARVLNGEKPLGVLTPQAAAVRTQNLDLPY